MCFHHDARPPALPPALAGAAPASAELLELTSADGTRFSAAFAESASQQETAVVILPDVRGLYRFYVELAERFAEAGHHAVAIDFFGRTLGTGERENDWDFWPHVLQTTPAQIQADAAAAIQLVRERTGASRFVTVGFCFGGSQSFLASANASLGLSGAVAFYGGLSRERWGENAPPNHAAAMHGPILGLFGGADEGIPAEAVEEFDALLSEAAVEHEFVTYEGAPHSFFDRKQTEYAEASEDAWRRVLAFLAD